MGRLRYSLGFLACLGSGCLSDGDRAPWARQNTLLQRGLLEGSLRGTKTDTRPVQADGAGATTYPLVQPQPGTPVEVPAGSRYF